DQLAQDAVIVHVSPRRLQLAFRLEQLCGQVPCLLLLERAVLHLLDLLLLVGQLVDSWLEAVNLFLLLGDTGVDPDVQALLGSQQFEDGVDGSEVESPEDGGQESAEDGENQALAVGQGVTQRAQKVLHGQESFCGGTGAGGASEVWTGCSTTAPAEQGRLAPRSTAPGNHC